MPGTKQGPQEPLQGIDGIPSLIARLDASIPGAVSLDALEGMDRRITVIEDDRRADAWVALLAIELECGALKLGRILGFASRRLESSLSRGRKALADTKLMASRR